MVSAADFLYVHDYGRWHIAQKETRLKALCGTAPSKPDWVSQARFHEPQSLDVDERSICGVCLLELPEEKSR